MSLKSCFVLLPGLVKTLKPNTVSNLNRPLLNLVNKPQRIAFLSTEKKPETINQKEIYYGILTPQIKAVKVFSLSSSIVGIVGQPFLYKAILSTGNVPVIVAAYSFIGFFTLVTPFLLHLITKKYVTHLLYKPETDSYVAKTVNFFCVTKETEFKIDDVKVPDVPGMFTTLLANGKPLFFDPRLFENPEHYARIMGYDKPIDFKLYETPPVDKKN
ncbi:transmembrane protein 70 homolog, mitochondrial [Tribolium madens]|uniref:transmembrane protein 70 homolog, mitochondrial n=1 Tax=Tribolium madens TaxID=41895 RepID=UPI001CF73E55|nr:transmembrane protein 70 homolog, mitochondrial [Tribolium madens]